MHDPQTMAGIKEGKKDLAEGRYSTFEHVFGMTPKQALTSQPEKD
jgi:hypothetical protein